MLQLIQPLAFRAAARGLSLSVARRGVHQQAYRSFRSSIKPLVFGCALTLSAVLAFQAPIHLDAAVPESHDETVDPATSIAFPNTLRIPSKAPLPTFTLVGVGVRTVSFLGIKVYSVGFYADLGSPKLNIPKSASPDEKIEHIVKNSACMLRIIPTRNTSYSHLRDGFVRAIQARMQLCRKRGQLTPEEEFGVQSPLRKFKSMFPNTPLTKHSPLDILVTASEPGLQRNLIVRDLGSVQDNWLAREFILAYFEGDGLSPPLKKSVVEKLKDFGRD